MGGFKIKNNEIFSYMRLNCDGGEFYYDGESIGDTFDFECSIAKGKRGPEGREVRKAQRLAKKKNEVERGAWRQTPECKKISSEGSPAEIDSNSASLAESNSNSNNKNRKKEKEGVDFGPWFINETEHLRVKYTRKTLLTPIHLRV